MDALRRAAGAELFGLYAIASTAGTAGGTGDNTQLTGATVNQVALVSAYGLRFDSLVVAIPYTTTLAADKKLTGALVVEESDDGTAWTTAETDATALLVEDGGSGGTYTGCALKTVDLRALKDYVRVKLTPDLDATGTDTFRLMAAYLLANPDRGVLPDKQA